MPRPFHGEPIRRGQISHERGFALTPKLSNDASGIDRDYSIFCALLEWLLRNTRRIIYYRPIFRTHREPFGLFYHWKKRCINQVTYGRRVHMESSHKTLRDHPAAIRRKYTVIVDCRTICAIKQSLGEIILFRQRKYLTRSVVLVRLHVRGKNHVAVPTKKDCLLSKVNSSPCGLNPRLDEKFSLKVSGLRKAFEWPIIRCRLAEHFHDPPALLWRPAPPECWWLAKVEQTFILGHVQLLRRFS